MSTQDNYPDFLTYLHERFPNCYFRTEYQPIPKRNFKVDVVLKCCKLAIEIEGGAYHGEGHRSVGVFLRNMEKYNILVTLEGWKLLRFTPKEIKNLTNNKLSSIIDIYFLRYPCPHFELNKALRISFLS